VAVACVTAARRHAALASAAKSGNIFAGYESAMTTPQTQFSKIISLRHALATLAYRAAKPLRDAPAGFSDFRADANSRSAGKILAHLAELMDWALTQASGQERWQQLEVRSWESDSQRFFASLTKLDEYIASSAELHVPPEKIFQGAIADSLTHIGQIAMLRRLANAPIRPENYSVANIEAGQTGPDQPPPRREFD
jgi:hypothetical protein